MSSPGFGVLIQMLGGNEDTVAAYRAAVGKRIATIEKLEQASAPGQFDHADQIKITFVDGAALYLWDAGQSCCEHRYITTDDDLASFAGQVLAAIEVRDAPSIAGEYGDEHEQQFVLISMGDGSNVTVCTHNEHNGYYGGFWLKLAYVAAEAGNEA